ncbi:hypothetical protein HDU99_008094, partial [Rhizoclosmatium hyalinum]
ESQELYQQSFHTAILEHIQLQLDALALKLHGTTSSSTGNSSYSPKVHIYPAAISLLTRESFQHKEGTPTFTERAGNFLLTFESKPQHIEVSK